MVLISVNWFVMVTKSWLAKMLARLLTEVIEDISNVPI